MAFLLLRRRGSARAQGPHQLPVASQAAPFPLGFHRELEDHRQGRFPGAAALGQSLPVPDGG